MATTPASRRPSATRCAARSATACRRWPRGPLGSATCARRPGARTATSRSWDRAPAGRRPAIPTPVGRAVGGTTVINSGTCFRAPDDVLAGWRDEHGIEWAAGLDGDYAEAEEIMWVRTVDPERMGRNGQLLREGAEALGVSHEPLRRNAGGCYQCSSCPSGCRLDAKRAAHVSYLPRAVAAGACVRAGVDACWVSFENGRAIGLDCVIRARGGTRPFRVRAGRAVVMAGGAFGTPELLLRSGFRAPSGQLGRNLRIHPACWVGARFDQEVRGWDGVMQSYAVSEWEDRGILLEATFTPLAFGAQWLPGTGAQHAERVLAYDRIASTGVHLSDRSAGRVGVTGDGSLRVTYGLTDGDASRLVFGIARAEALYVADGSLLPSSIGVNPMMTIIAMASRVAHQLADRLN